MQITPYPKNAKKHPPSQIQALARAIKAFGFSPAIEVDKDGVIISGHGRWLAAQNLGWQTLKMAPRSPKGEEVVPYIILDDLTPLEIKQKRLADNKLAETDIDMILALEELKEIKLEGGDITLTGYDTDLLIETDEKDDLVPDVPVEPQSKLGDLYELGNHKILCGDSTKVEDVERLMDGKKAELLFTSPPYSDMREYGGGKNLSVSHLSGFLPVFYPWVSFAVVNLGIQRKNGEVYAYWDDYIHAGRDCGYKLLAWNVWEKNNLSIGSQSAFIPISHEWLFVFGKDFKDINRTELRKEKRKNTKGYHRGDGDKMERHNIGKQENLVEMRSVFRSNSNTSSDENKKHPATFPVELPQQYLKAMTSQQDIVVDPFLGSGSTIIACEKTGRICYGIELDPKYVDVIVQRYVDYVGNDKIKLNGNETHWEKRG